MWGAGAGNNLPGVSLCPSLVQAELKVMAKSPVPITMAMPLWSPASEVRPSRILHLVNNQAPDSMKYTLEPYLNFRSFTFSNIERFLSATGLMTSLTCLSARRSILNAFHSQP